ncbi:MAG: tripartite tricarboxylate transporter TctB family protein [Methylobacteriaceae bacterium]|nr:tripartite tricarboxylate transporter TctB family protein [Methylobacteriaceae bacterium]
MRFDDRLAALLFLALGATLIAATLNFPAFPGQKYGPALFPRILGAGLIVCALALFVRAQRAAASGAPLLRIDPALKDPRRIGGLLLVVGANVFYLLAAERLGFIPTAFLLLLALMAWFGVRPLTNLAVALVMTAAVHWFFGTLMRVPLPRGLFMQIVAGG